jgi:hypothetical protein
VHRFLAQISRIQVQLYERDFAQALSTVRRLGVEFRTSTIRRVQLCRVLYHHHSAFVALALASHEPSSGQKRRLRRAKKHQKKLEQENTPWGNAYARYVAAARHLLEDESEKGIKGLRDAIVELDACDMVSVAAGARFRLGQWVGGAEGESLLNQARAFMRTQGVVAPDRLLDALAPLRDGPATSGR